MVSCKTHCCKRHGCKYCRYDCPVEFGDHPGVNCDMCERDPPRPDLELYAIRYTKTNEYSPRDSGSANWPKEAKKAKFYLTKTEADKWCGILNGRWKPQYEVVKFELKEVK